MGHIVGHNGTEKKENDCNATLSINKSIIIIIITMKIINDHKKKRAAHHALKIEYKMCRAFLRRHALK